MPFLTIAFPVFDPIAISIGPIAIRWYALAYIGGIVLGWLYARALIKNERLWGGPAPITPPQLDDFILWVTVGIILGGRTGYVLFYNLPFFIQHPAEIFELWKGGMSFLGSFIAIYGFARIIGEFFREPDPQLGFLWGGLTMGMLLSVPMIIAGAIIIVVAWRRKPLK